jgi:hypothetical protein
MIKKKKVNERNKDINKNEMGITLVALVVTIIVLLILAGVTIATLTGDNGLLTKAGDARNTSEKAGEKERIQMEVAGAYDLTGKLVASQVEENIRNNIKDITNVTATAKEGTEEKFFPVKATYNNGHKYQVDENGQIMMSVNAGDKAPSDSNAVYSSGDYTAIIPAGFTVSATESSIENGLVVTDGTTNQNEWVWIPVSSTDLAKMYTEDTTGWNMLGTSVNTKLKTKELTTQNTFKLGSRELPRTNPGTTADPYYREPDVLSEYDTDQSYRTQAGFGDLADMATKLKNDYKDMIDSVRENGGFYIGRYELGKDSSNNPQVKAGTVMNSTNWYNLYSACKSFSSGKVESRMIWGCQWDQVCRFISTLGDNKVSSLDDSTSYGNYSGSTDYKTGTRNKCITNNIYDLAGNYWEWTQEAYHTLNRASRGRRLL